MSRNLFASRYNSGVAKRCFQSSRFRFIDGTISLASKSSTLRYGNFRFFFCVSPLSLRNYNLFFGLLVSLSPCLLVRLLQRLQSFEGVGLPCTTSSGRPRKTINRSTTRLRK